MKLWPKKEKMDKRSAKKWWRPALSLATILILLLIAVLFFAPLSENGIHVTAKPDKSYDEAMAEVAAISKSEGDNIMPECHSFAATTGKKTDNVVVIFHGFTNCPVQYQQFSKDLVSQGYNVVVLRMPKHGEKDRANNDLSTLTNAELAQYANTSIDIADGLGENVYLSGLSVGGTISAWIAQERPEVKGYVNLAPFYAPKYVPDLLIKPAVRILNILPPITIWWDNKTKENNVTGSPYAYPGFDTRSLAKFLSFGVFAQQQNRRQPHAIKQGITLNENDTAINNNAAESIEKSIFKSTDKYNFSLYFFAKDKKLNHDVIDPYNPEQNTAYTYPIIIEQINTLIKTP